MKKIFVITTVAFLFLACDKKSKVEKAVEEIPVTMKVVRFEQDFFNAKPQDLPKLKAQYPEFFPVGTPDAVWTEKQQNKDWRDLYTEVEKQYKDFSGEQTDIEDLFKHIKYYFPKVNTPQIYTVIGDMDYKNKVIYAPGKLIVCLEMCLGKDSKFYVDIPEYIKQNFDRKQILPDIVTGFSYQVNPAPKSKEFVAQMVYFGKELYMKDLLLPNYSDAEKIGYTEDQIKFCQGNEYYIWSYFIEKQLLYDTNPKLLSQFITMAPFSKFYLELDNETPGRIGQWVGWQIVRSYMENNQNVSLEQLLKTDPKTIFEQSKYKPKKNE